MKIYYIAFVRLPTEKAHGLQIMKTCEALADAAVEVELVTPGRKTSVAGDPFEYYEVTKSFALTTLNTPDWVQRGFVGFLLSVVWFAEACKLRKAFWRADIIYSRDALVLLQYILLGRRLVYEAHRAPTLVDRIVARRAYRVITITASLKAEFVKAGVAESRILVAHDAVDAPRAHARDLHDRPRVVYAGSRGRGKGVETLEAAVSLIPEVDVELVSGKPPREVREILAAADIVVVPNSARVASSKTFTSPMKLFEALASGARIVASDVPAIREVVDEASVWFFAPDDPQSLAATIREALADPTAATKVSAALALSQRYSWEARAANILSVLK